MKYNLRKVDLHNKPKMFGKWWSWNAKCDYCGEDINMCSVLRNYQPDFSEKDFCLSCMMYFIKNGITYEDVINNKFHRGNINE